LVLVVGCSHPGIERIVEAAAAINPKIRLITGGFHLVVAPDDMVMKVVTALKDKFKPEYIAPGHCTGEPTFAALKKAFGDKYVYAGLGTSIPLGPNAASGVKRGESPIGDDLVIYRKFAAREDPFGIVRSRNPRLAASP
jgi:7,8-dihydropterin-6-yl-methyl-4-(beta-D-ribofuranosyl)aminobenzene 5'-phosphate synthase